MYDYIQTPRLCCGHGGYGGYDHVVQVTVVLLTESLKVCLCVALYLREEGNSINSFTAAVTGNTKIFRLYFVPAGLCG